MTHRTTSETELQYRESRLKGRYRTEIFQRSLLFAKENLTTEEFEITNLLFIEHHSIREVATVYKKHT